MKSIIFNAQEVKATLEGRKTQFRKVIKPQPINNINPVKVLGCANTWKWSTIESRREAPYEVGDEIFVKEREQEQSRLTLRIKNIRVERLEDISDEDCEKEGVNCWGGYRIGDSDDYTDPQYFFYEEKLPCTCYETEEGPEMCGNCLWGSPLTYDNPYEPFIEFWDDKYPKHPFESNPWVWIVEFETINN